MEMKSSGPWPQTEINTTSGDEASAVQCTSMAVRKMLVEGEGAKFGPALPTVVLNQKSVTGDLG